MGRPRTSAPPTMANCRKATTAWGCCCGCRRRSARREDLRRQGRGPAQRSRHRPSQHPQGRPSPKHRIFSTGCPSPHGRRAGPLHPTQRSEFLLVSINGYHIAEAGANPITQSPHPANGFTYVEYYLSRGMDIDKFGPNRASSPAASTQVRRDWAGGASDGPKRCARNMALPPAPKC